MSSINDLVKQYREGTISREQYYAGLHSIGQRSDGTNEENNQAYNAHSGLSPTNNKDVPSASSSSTSKVPNSKSKKGNKNKKTANLSMSAQQSFGAGSPNADTSAQEFTANVKGTNMKFQAKQLTSPNASPKNQKRSPKNGVKTSTVFSSPNNAKQAASAASTAGPGDVNIPSLENTSFFENKKKIPSKFLFTPQDDEKSSAVVSAQMTPMDSKNVQGASNADPNPVVVSTKPTNKVSGAGTHKSSYMTLANTSTHVFGGQQAFDDLSRHTKAPESNSVNDLKAAIEALEHADDDESDDNIVTTDEQLVTTDEQQIIVNDKNANVTNKNTGLMSPRSFLKSQKQNSKEAAQANTTNVDRAALVSEQGKDLLRSMKSGSNGNNSSAKGNNTATAKNTKTIKNTNNNSNNKNASSSAGQMSPRSFLKAQKENSNAPPPIALNKITTAQNQSSSANQSFNDVSPISYAASESQNNSRIEFVSNLNSSVNNSSNTNLNTNSVPPKPLQVGFSNKHGVLAHKIAKDNKKNKAKSRYMDHTDASAHARK